MTKKIRTALCVIVSVLFLASCSSRPDGMHVILFSDMQAGVQEKIKKAAEQNAGKVDIFLQEKLLTEITAHEGDVFIVPEDMFQAYDDPENFQPLNGLPPKKTSPYTTVNKKTGEKTIYAVQIEKGKKQLNGYSFRLNRDMVAFIPVYAEKTEEALQLISQLTEAR
ncbi:rhamnogalaturonan transport/degradation protein RmgS [Bacillus subtilis]|uniref:rhamnogalaturonan transport/degradation protein RmgS n=1 Tax=Bacillus subtilis TaxID=1423 RepID=UPI001C8DFAA8|nr:rhamnogalaturonan transport/degradation protein RmgS [Bacillus subtilis]MBY0182839.1 lipoprotein YteS [Bacillus subtilis]MED1805027.1 rhamnogalaturonan transport/degradation protein RmgS [Bacillus subtilis]MED4610581.1 rhamnogalaturonan transport/degradation protein RmgS [Bacillus subtilis]UUH69458.1 rhamnogalaturonan transport/degradation protein RmgS [Bacillus subtilis subsp. subtilis]UUH81479.1 rhamnogalaturonan transport/degradation protein RmgS [Bacillus subtilis]